MKNKLILFAAQILILMSLDVFSQSPRCPNPVPITNDPAYTYPLGNGGVLARKALDSIFAYCAWSITKGDPDIIVGVIDTEFDLNHEDMKNTFVSVVGTKTFPENHGTGVSSLVASSTNNGIGMAGIGYNTRIIGYCADTTNVGSAVLVWERVKQAYLAGIKIINVSWRELYGYKDSDSLYLKQMLNDGVVLTLSAGNSIDAMDHKNYANFPGIINVSCVDEKNQHKYTNTARNTWVDVCATSTSIVAAAPTYDLINWPPDCIGNAITGWYCLSGIGTRAYSSHAAPQVAGTVALMRSVNSFLSSAQIEHIIKTTGDEIKDDSLFKGRTVNNPPPKRVNAYEAVKEAKRLACGTTNTFSKTINNINESVNGGNIIISNTTVAAGKRLSVRACNSVTITGTFSVDAGATLNINVIP
jgi:subtilisin family serine protease